MSKIIISVCGVGLGHAARESALIKELKKNNEVIVTTYGNAFNYLKEFNPIKINGFKIIYLNGKYNELLSILINIPVLPIIAIKNFLTFKKLVKEFKPDLIISDYDVFSLYTAKLFNIPSILISNMHAINYFKIKKTNTPLITKILGLKTLNFFNHLIVLSLKKHENKKNISFYTMIIKPELLKTKPIEKNYYLVYSNKEQLKQLIPLLKKINQKFVVFGSKGKAKNIKFYEKYSIKTFTKKLIECKGIMSHGGYSLISEAIHLKKPIYTFTTKEFYERYFNGTIIQELGFGVIEEKPTLKGLTTFMNNTKKYKQNIKKSRIKAENKQVIKQIKKIIKQIKKD